MMQKPPRPTGVAILAILDIIGGIIALLVGGLLAVGSSALTAFYGTFIFAGFLAVIGGIVAVVGILAVLVGWGLWSGKGWAWTLAFVLAILGIVGGLISVAFGGFTSVVGLLIDVLIVWYLLRPHVKAYFGRGIAAAQPASMAQNPPPTM